MATTDSIDKETGFPWYDSLWMSRYVRALQIIDDAHPEKAADFRQAFARLRCPLDYRTQHLREVLDPETFQQLKLLIAYLGDSDLDNRDLLTLGRLVFHNHPDVTEIHRRLATFVSESVGEEVVPSYNLLSLYTNLGICQVHMDSPESKWTLDVCLDQSDVWPIWVSRPQPWPEKFPAAREDWDDKIVSNAALEFQQYELETNEAVLFAAGNQWHYRDRISRAKPRNYCHLVMFQFVPIRSRELLDPGEWSRIFEVPELADLRYPCHQVLENK